MTSYPVTLQMALKHARDTRWRDNDSAWRQAQKALGTLMRVHHGPDLSAPGALTFAEDIGDRDVQQATALWYAEGLSPATINKRLSCLSSLGVNIPSYAKDPPKLKWWLRPEEEVRALRWLKGQGGLGGSAAYTLADLIWWTTRTGLRIEESLRLAWEDSFDATTGSVLVPGLKTALSQATLPLSSEVQKRVAIMHTDVNLAATGMVFPYSYERLEAEWRKLRTAMGWEGNGVTMKALRRSAARYLHVDCGMPLDMVRHYLRHEDIQTTMGYLRLTGGYGTEEMRRYLK